MGFEEPLWRQAATHTLHASFLIKARVEERLQERMGLLLADNEALLNLAAADDALRMSDIAERLVLSPGGTTKVIDRLEEMGFVERKPDPTDRRATVVEITNAGTDAMVAARAVVDEALGETWQPNVSNDEARTVVEVMRRVVGLDEA
jgi:DNA-binding MarR family transcriptional regulator